MRGRAVGRIELVLPEKAKFDLQATAEHGEAVNDYGDAIQKETEGRTSTLKGRVGDGPTIRLTANRGSVTVRREGTEPSEDSARPPAARRRSRRAFPRRRLLKSRCEWPTVIA